MPRPPPSIAASTATRASTPSRTHSPRLPESFSGFLCNLADRRVVADDPERRFRIHHLDRARPVALVVDDHVAGQQQANPGIGLQGAVGQRWVAGAEDDVRSHVDPELFLQRLLHVDGRQDAEALLLKRRDGSLDRLLVADVQHTSKSIRSLRCWCGHGMPPPLPKGRSRRLAEGPAPSPTKRATLLQGYSCSASDGAR